jgi:ABC-type phosphate/phosphonate transport system substrate-binding protein
VEDLARGAVALPDLLGAELREQIISELDRKAPGWTAVSAGSDAEAVRLLVERELGVVAAASRHVVSGPHDLVGDGAKELEASRPGTVRETRLLFSTPQPVHEDATVYYGCILSRSDSGIHRLEDLRGKSFAFSDETSTSGHVFARALLQRAGVTLGHVLFAGGHPNVVQAVFDGKVAGGAAFYSPPSEVHQRDQLFVGDARHLILKRMKTVEEREDYLRQVRIIALTDPIPNDVCCVRKGFSESLWSRFEASLQRFLATPEGQRAYDDLVAGVAAAPCSDADFQGFRKALRATGVSAARLLEEAERKLESRKGRGS